MELKAKINKPYTKAQRQEFIIEQNHNKGFEIKETETALEAWGYSAEERQEQAEQKRKAEIMSQLDAIDLKCIRALRAIQAGTATDEDRARLDYYETEAEELRRQLSDE